MAVEVEEVLPHVQLVPGGDGEVFDPPLDLRLVELDPGRSHFIAEAFTIEPLGATGNSPGRDRKPANAAGHQMLLDVTPRIVLIASASGAVPAAETTAPAVVVYPGAWSNLLGRFDVSTPPHPTGGFPLDPQCEENKPRDTGAADCGAGLGSSITWTDVDRMWAAGMERTDREAACPKGYRNAACEACDCAFYVAVG